MGEGNPELKPDEQYPLLKIDGGGDKNAQPAQAVVTPGWGVCTKVSRFSRWPEFISACWMTVILCGISFLVFHSLGMAFYRRQQFLIMKCNNSRPESNVYYHHIVQRGCQIPFVVYTEYLSSMAVQYPNLNFNLIFLVDDLYPDSIRNPRRSISIYQPWIYNYHLDEISKETINDFKRRYQNVNVTVFPLSKFMAMTPLKYRWRLIPQAYLSFYARVYSVWQNGGIGIDIRTFNNEYHNRVYTDSRIDAILRQHNDGINVADYKKALNKINNDEANAVFNMFLGLINNVLRESRSFFNFTPSLSQFSNTKNTMTRSLHNKREMVNNSLVNILTGPSKDMKNDTKINYNDTNSLNVVPTNYTNSYNLTFEAFKNVTDNLEKKSANSTHLKNSKVNGNSSEPHQVILFYDFSFISDNAIPSFPAFFTQKQSSAPKTVPQLLSMDGEGTLIAASSKFHPFLAHLSSTGRLGMPPKFAIQNALLTQCGDVFKDDEYCNNINIL